LSQRYRTGYGVWVEVSERSAKIYYDNFELVKAKHLGPFSGRFADRVPDLPETMGMNCKVHLSDEGQRPSVELLPAKHPFYDEHKNGIPLERAIALSKLIPGFELFLDA
jgi:hypothetical protein